MYFSIFMNFKKYYAKSKEFKRTQSKIKIQEPNIFIYFPDVLYNKTYGLIITIQN
ncbi:hypothetical protein DOY81_009641 [Sarcophaga bullata]|nr:hypothetical protein DOY81_009641 [Sarcophaga bullata]